MKQHFWAGVGACFGMLALILDGQTALDGATEGLSLCFRTVIPSLFPFFVLSILLTSSLMGCKCTFLTRLGKLFHIPAGAESLLIPAFLGGYPIGAKTVAQIYQSGYIPKEDAQRLLAFCNNAGPAFLFGMMGSLFSARWMVWLLWTIHIFSAWIVSRFFPVNTPSVSLRKGKPITPEEAVSSSLRTMGQVCGWIILFRTLIAFLKRWVLWILPEEIQVLVIGLLELANGCKELGTIANEPVRFLLGSCMLSCGGLCVSMQTVSVVQGLSVKNYFTGKLMQTFFSVLFSAALMYQLWWLFIPILPVLSIILRKKEKRYSIPQKAVV